MSLFTRGVLAIVISTLATITKQAADTINGKPCSTLSKSKLNAKASREGTAHALYSRYECGSKSCTLWREESHEDRSQKTAEANSGAKNNDAYSRSVTLSKSSKHFPIASL
ncbi:hypothetical protein BCON_0092g00170 [Botryotinia convoluta]|uniref:Uncharacterized protein n=1 Tax=Botryotinia convoluta TaxID=54673 RepID=A0A4Z1I413_9HELO|nr:hypothetical protein BCON_0092g00170 [Botryotinia convoluta]